MKEFPTSSLIRLGEYWLDNKYQFAIIKVVATQVVSVFREKIDRGDENGGHPSRSMFKHTSHTKTT